MLRGKNSENRIAHVQLDASSGGRIHVVDVGFGLWSISYLPSPARSALITVAYGKGSAVAHGTRKFVTKLLDTVRSSSFLLQVCLAEAQEGSCHEQRWPPGLNVQETELPGQIRTKSSGN